MLFRSPENPGTDNPGIDNPEPENPGTENPGTENPGTDNPGTDNPEPEKPGTDNPAPVIPVEPTNSNTDNTRKNLDFEINKYISKVTVSTVNGTKEYKFNNEQLAKTEIRAKEMNGATVVVEYKIVVKNIGNVAGKIGEIADYLPAGLTFSSQLNKEWIQSTDGKLKYSGNSDYIMQAGEAKTITLIATKQMSQNTTGNFINRAEIKNISTTSGLKETNTENNASQAELIISTSTGAYVYIGIGILALTALIILAVILVKKGKLNIKNPKISIVYANQHPVRQGLDVAAPVPEGFIGAAGLADVHALGVAAQCSVGQLVRHPLAAAGAQRPALLLVIDHLLNSFFVRHCTSSLNISTNRMVCEPVAAPPE